MLDEKKMKIIARASEDFDYFLKKVFAKSFDKFIAGKHVTNTANFLQDNTWTMRVSARDHMKSLSLYAHFMWQLFKRTGLEAHYFSFQQNMAGYHISKIKKLIMVNPFYEDLIDDKKTAENVIKYHWEGLDEFYTLEPHGLLGFKRGIHCPIVYVDDPFQDPANKLILTVISKINSIFKTQILDMPRDELHVVGTPQTNSDFFFDQKLRKKFEVKIMPAIVSEKKKIVLWPEWKDWEELQEIKDTRGEKIFNQEYLCSPVYAEEGFFTRDQIMERVNEKLENLNINDNHQIEEDVIGGFDIGKKRHPAHLSVFKLVNNRYIQIHHKFMDGWKYIDQLDYLVKSIKSFKINELNFDDTRGEFESFDEEGRLPEAMNGVAFTNKKKHQMATSFSQAVESNKIELIDDRRQIEQILMVTNDLQALETPEGHGDSFWSNALCFKEKEAQFNVRFVE